MINNRKGFAVALVLPIVVGIIAIIAAFAFLASTKIRITLIGVGLLVATFMYIIPAIVKSDLSNRKLAFTAIFIILGIGLVLIPNLGVTQTAFGSSTLSVQQADLQSSSPFFSGKTWLLTFRSGGLAQSYTGTFTPTDVDAVTSGSTRPTKSFTMDVKYDDQTCEYPIATSSLTPIYDLEYKEYTSFTCVNFLASQTSKENDAKSQTGLQNVLYYGKYTGTTCWALGYNTQSVVGTLPNVPNINNQYTITVDVEGTKASKTINTINGERQGPIGSFAYAVYQGSLVTGTQCPSSGNYQSAYINGQWKIIDKNAYNLYNTRFNTNILSETCKATQSCVTSWFTTTKNLADAAKVTKSFGTLTNAASTSNAIVKIVQDNPVTFPVTTLYIKADTLGIFTPAPELQITSSNSACFRTGDTGSLAVGLKNIGTDRGTWTVSANCPSPFQATTTEISLAAGESRTINLALSASASSQQTATCTITANGVSGTKTATVGVCAQPQVTCTVPSSTKFCGFNGQAEAVKQCSADGAVTNIVQTCSATETCDIATATCKLKPVTTTTTTTPSTVDTSSTQAACEAKSASNPLLGYTWTIVTTQPSITQQIFSFGTAKPTTTGYCRASFVPYYVWGTLALIIIGLLYYILRTPTKRRKK